MVFRPIQRYCDNHDIVVGQYNFIGIDKSMASIP